MTPKVTAAAATLALILLPALAACGGGGGGLSSLAGSSTPAPASTSATPESSFTDDSTPPDSSSSADDSTSGGGCGTLLTDLEGIEGDLSGATSAGDLSNKVKALETKLTKDAAGGSPALQTAVKNYNDLLSKIVKDASSGNSSALTKDEQDLTSVATKLGAACE